MALNLIPDDVPPASAEPEGMSEDAARAYLMGLHSPLLDALRVRIRTQKTSELFALLVNPEHVAHTTGTIDMSRPENHDLLMAAMLAVADEVDRRFPVPT